MTFNRTTVECKGYKLCLLSLNYTPFNRTTVECKVKYKGERCLQIYTFNRTTVECKEQSSCRAESISYSF